MSDHGSVKVRTQADADQLIPELLQQAGGRIVRVVPEGSIDLTRWLGQDWYRHVGPCGCSEARDPWTRCGACENAGWEPPQARGLQRVIVDGGDKPMHPAWVCRLRDDCEAAGVEFVFVSWGEWHECGATRLPCGKYTHELPDADSHPRVRLSICGCNSQTGQPVTSTGAHTCDLSYDNWMQRVGRKLSGRMLDGRHWPALESTVEFMATRLDELKEAAGRELRRRDALERIERECGCVRTPNDDSSVHVDVCDPCYKHAIAESMARRRGRADGERVLLK